MHVSWQEHNYNFKLWSRNHRLKASTVIPAALKHLHLRGQISPDGGGRSLTVISPNIHASPATECTQFDGGDSTTRT